MRKSRSWIYSHRSVLLVSVSSGLLSSLSLFAFPGLSRLRSSQPLLRQSLHPTMRCPPKTPQRPCPTISARDSTTYMQSTAPTHISRHIYRLRCLFRPWHMLQPALSSHTVLSCPPHLPQRYTNVHMLIKQLISLVNRVRNESSIFIPAPR